MNRLALTTCTLVAIGCSLVIAGPAQGASAAPSAKPENTSAARASTSLAITLDTYDPVTHDATVTVTGTYYGDTFSIIQKGLIDETTASTVSFDIVHVGDETGSVTRTIHDVFKGDSVQVREGLNPTADSVTITDGPALPTSTVSTTTENGTVRGTYIHARSGWTHVYDADGREVAFTANATHLADGSYKTAFALPDTGRTSEFTAEAAHVAGIRSTVHFAINEGASAVTVEAPGVGTVVPVGSRASATLTGETGAVVTVKDASGTTVAVKIVGAGGTAQVLLPASSNKKTSAFTATQTAGGTTSEATPFTI